MRMWTCDQGQYNPSLRSKQCILHERESIRLNLLDVQMHLHHNQTDVIESASLQRQLDERFGHVLSREPRGGEDASKGSVTHHLPEAIGTEQKNITILKLLGEHIDLNPWHRTQTAR